MAKFKFIYWLVEFLLSGEDFIFDWNEGNSTKSEEKHGVSLEMVESAFQDGLLLALGESNISQLLTKSDMGLLLNV